MNVKKLMIAAAITGMISIPAAANDCAQGSETPVRLETWTATVKPTAIGDATAIVLTITNKTGRPIRMIDAYVSFADALGGAAGSWSLPKDDPIPALGATEIRFNSMGVERIAAALPEDIEAMICTNGLIYGDGTKETF